MKKIIVSLALIAIIAMIFIASCQKTYNPYNQTQSAKQLFSSLLYTPQALSVTAGRDTIVYGADSTILHFYTNSFKDVNGNTITSGTINLQLVEMYRPGDMICNCATTMTLNGNILTSGGQITITATMNGRTVYANKYGAGFIQHTASAQPMELYYGSTSTSGSATTWNVGNNTTPGTTASGTDTSALRNVYMYIFDSIPNFGSVNCDALLQITHTADSPLTTVTVVLPDNSFVPLGSVTSNTNASASNANTDIYLILPAYNSVLSFYGIYNQATNTVTLRNDGTEIPIGINYELVVITVKNTGQFYYYEQSGVTTSGLTINAAPAPESQGDIISRLQGL